MKLTDQLVDRASNLAFGCAGIWISLGTVAATAGAAAPFAGAMAGAAVMGFAFAARQKHAVESARELGRIRDRIRKAWRRDPEISAEGQRAIDEACRLLPELLPECMLEPAKLASFAAKEMFPKAATDQVMAALAALPGQEARFKDADSGPETNPVAEFTRAFLNEAFTAAIEDESYFKKFQPHLMVQQSRLLGQILEHVETIAADNEQFRRLLEAMEAKLDSGLTAETIVALTRLLPSDAGDTPNALVTALMVRYQNAQELHEQGVQQSDLAAFVERVVQRIDAGMADLDRKIDATTTFEPLLDLRERSASAGGGMFFFASEDGIPLFGRQGELEALLEWAREGGKFSWALLIGDGGTGKSRLAFELAKHLRGEKWRAGFVHRGEMKSELFAWFRPKDPTLVIVDYAGLNPHATGEVFLTLRNLAARGQFNARVRLLLIERDGRESAWYKEVHRTGGIDDKSSQDYRAGFDELKLGDPGDDALYDIMKFAAGEAPVPEKESALQQLRAIDERGRPLFAALAGAAVRNGRSIRELDRSALLDDVLAREEARWRALAGSEAILKRHKNAAALATIVGGLSYRAIPAEVAGMTALPFSEEAFDVKLAAEMTGAQDAEALHAMEPDIVGEWFVLSHFSRSSFDKDKPNSPFHDADKVVMQAVYSVASEIPIKWADVDAFLGRTASDFPLDLLKSKLLAPPEAPSCEDIAEWCKVIGTVSQRLASRELLDEAFELVRNAHAHVGGLALNDPDIKQSLIGAVSKTLNAVLQQSISFRFRDRWADGLDFWMKATEFAAVYEHDDAAQAKITRAARYFASDSGRDAPGLSLQIFWRGQEHLKRGASAGAIDEIAKTAAIFANTREDVDLVDVFSHTAARVTPIDDWGRVHMRQLRRMCIRRTVERQTPADQTMRGEQLVRRAEQSASGVDAHIALEWLVALVGERLEADDERRALRHYAEANRLASDFKDDAEIWPIAGWGTCLVVRHWLAGGKPERAFDEFRSMIARMERIAQAHDTAAWLWGTIGVELLEALMRKQDFERALALTAAREDLFMRMQDGLGGRLAFYLFDLRAERNDSPLAVRMRAANREYARDHGVKVGGPDPSAAELILRCSERMDRGLVEVAGLARDYAAAAEDAERREIVRRLFWLADNDLSGEACATIRERLQKSTIFDSDIGRGQEGSE